MLFIKKCKENLHSLKKQFSTFTKEITLGIEFDSNSHRKHPYNQTVDSVLRQMSFSFLEEGKKTPGV